jgi:hypothetical protein
MNVPINKIGDFETEHNTLKYRQPLKEFNTTEFAEIERALKKKAKELEKYPYYLNPFDIETINSFVVLYYDVKHFYRFDVIRQLDFKDKLILFTSLIEIMKHKEVNILWNRHNFLFDVEEKEFRVILYETEAMKIHQEVDRFKETKNLILMSLTTLNEIYAKPKRTDFIDQDDNIIKFAETILKIDNESDLEDYIETMRLEYEYKDVNVSDDKKEKKGKKKDTSAIKIKKKQPVQSRPNNKKNQKKNDLLSKRNILIAVGLLLALLLNTVLPNLDKGKEKEDEGVEVTNTVPVVANSESEDTEEATEDREYSSEEANKLLEAYRSTLHNDHEKALSILQEIGYNKLNNADQEVMLRIYEDNKQYTHVIQLAPERAMDIVNELIASDDKDSIYEIYNNLQSPNPYVSFEVFYFNRNWEEMIKLKDQVELNGRKEQQIFDGYINLKQYDNAEQFANEVGNPDLLKQIPE